MSPAARKASVSMLMPILDVCLSMTIITLSPGSLQYMQHRQVAQGGPHQPRLSQEEIDRLRAEYQELWRRYEELLALFHQKPSPEPVDLNRLQAAQHDLNQVVEALRKEIARLRELLNNTQPTDAQTQKRLEELRRLLEELQKKIAQAQEQLKHLQYTQEQLQKIQELKEEIAKLKEQLAQAQKKGIALDEEIARMEAQMRKNAVVIKVHPRVRYPEQMHPKQLILSKATITPMEPPYYQEKKADTLTLVPGGIRIGTLQFVRPGPSASEALQPGSEFLEWVDRIDRQKEYVFMYVDGDSFETFRAVREVLRQRGIQVGWEPDEKGNEDVSIVHVFGSRPLPPVQ